MHGSRLRPASLSEALAPLSDMVGSHSRSSRLERNHSISSDVSMHVSKLANNGGQLIVVANRLPVSVTADPNAEGGYRFSVSSGGLASALSGCKKRMDFVVSSLPGISRAPARLPRLARAVVY